MVVNIIRAGVEHVDVVAPLFDRYRQFYGQPSDLTGARTFLSDRLKNQQSVVFIAVDAAETGLGFTQLYPSFTSVRMKPLWILNDLFVADEARRRGVGRQLMDAALELAKSTGAARLVLSTAKDNTKAKSLYLSLGYRGLRLYRCRHAGNEARSEARANSGKL
jgi:ribosomal protein S18 acetylase RimI-like enzyme